jgi:predicted dehydrogenase
MREYELVGCHDADLAAGKAQAEFYGITFYETPEELFQAVDVVNIAAPSFLHKQLAVAAAQAGCHVLVEKPIALTIADGQEIINACQKAGVRLCVGHVERFNPAISTMQQIIEHEELISIDFQRMSPFFGRVSDASVVEDLMIHDIDVLNAISPSPIKRIVSHGVKVHTDKLDYVQTLVTYENGLVASLTASRVTQSKIRQAEINALNSYISVDYLNRTVEIARKTNISLDLGHPVQYTQESIIEKVFVPINEPLRSEFEHFAYCINTGETIATSGEMGLKALELCHVIQDEALVREVSA